MCVFPLLGPSVSSCRGKKWPLGLCHSDLSLFPSQETDLCVRRRWRPDGSDLGNSQSRETDLTCHHHTDILEVQIVLGSRKGKHEAL